jgi:Ca-activated chloride channel homolog
MMMLPLVVSLLLQAQGAPAFKSSSELVVLHVAVVDHHAGFVAGLPRAAFSVYEDGRPRSIAFFQDDDTPVTVGLLIDSSGSMVSRRKAVIAAGMAFAESSRADDEMFTIAFNEKVWRGLPDGQAFTSDHTELHEALNRSGARGQTALFDAVDAGLRQLDEGARARKVLIVVSDGGDNASHTSFDHVLDAALRHDVVIYTVGIYDADDGDARPGVLKDLASATGGEAFFPKTIDDVQPALERIARDIRSSYTIGYVPPTDGPAGHKHTVRVDLHPPDGRKLAVRARSAYVRDGHDAGNGRE